jgi:uncharacterized protein YegL
MAKKPNPKAYISTSPVYTGDVYYRPGEAFVTDVEPNDEWTAVDGDTLAAIEAADPLIHADVNLDDLDTSALKGYAASLGVDTTGLKDDDAIKTAIRAVNDPAR